MLLIGLIVVIVAFLILGVACFYHFFGYKSDSLEWYTSTDNEGCTAHHQQHWQQTEGTKIVEGKLYPKTFNWCPICKAVRGSEELPLTAEECEVSHREQWQGSGAKIYTLCGDSRAKIAYRCPLCEKVRTVNEV